MIKKKTNDKILDEQKQDRMNWVYHFPEDIYSLQWNRCFYTF